MLQKKPGECPGKQKGRHPEKNCHCCECGGLGAEWRPEKEVEMIITRKYARKMIREGKAGYTNDTERSSVVNHNNKQYVAINRYDKQRVDHYEL